MPNQGQGRYRRGPKNNPNSGPKDHPSDLPPDYAEMDLPRDPQAPRDWGLIELEDKETKEILKIAAQVGMAEEQLNGA